MRKQLLMLVILLMPVLAACGGGNSAKTSYRVTLTDFAYTPNELTVPAGQEITVDAANTGAVIHNFIIMNLGASAGTEYTAEDDANVYWKLEVPAGGSTTTTFTAPTETGEYEIVCSTPGHLQAGMIGKLIVVASE
jgi:plastocyanin